MGLRFAPVWTPEEAKRTRPLRRHCLRPTVKEQDILERLERIEAVLQLLVTQRSVKDYYTTAEAARNPGEGRIHGKRVVPSAVASGPKNANVAAGTPRNGSFPMRSSRGFRMKVCCRSDGENTRHLRRPPVEPYDSFPNTCDIASRWESGKRCVYRFRISSVW